METNLHYNARHGGGTWQKFSTCIGSLQIAVNTLSSVLRKFSSLTFTWVHGFYDVGSKKLPPVTYSMEALLAAIAVCRR
jgi:hypothetical protein